MIAFIRNYEELLPYKRENYLSYLDDDPEFDDKWFGISIQPQTHQNHLKNTLSFMARTFKKLIDYYDKGMNWLVIHEYKDLPWFPSNKKGDDVTLPDLRQFFKDNRVSKHFIGGLSLPKDIITGQLLKDITTYPYLMFPDSQFLYKDLEITHSSIPLIIKITGHKNNNILPAIDLLSTDIKLIKEVNKMKFSGSYEKVQYNNSKEV